VLSKTSGSFFKYISGGYRSFILFESPLMTRQVTLTLSTILDSLIMISTRLLQALEGIVLLTLCLFQVGHQGIDF
jgi:hypothetical protein